jgi:hypothetical protein
MSTLFHRRAREPMLAVLALLLLVLAACSSAGVATIESADAETDATPSAEADPEQAMLDFAECMRENGVEVADPTGAGGLRAIFGEDVDRADPEVQAAMDACREHLEGTFGDGDGGPGQLTPEQEEQMLAFAECMREHGIDVPDPGAGGSRGGFAAADIDPQSPEFQAAMDACGGGVFGGGGGVIGGGE